MNEVELLFNQVRLGESSKKTLEKLAQELLDKHNEVYPSDKLQLDFWDEGHPVELRSGERFNVVISARSAYNDLPTYIYCSTQELDNPYIYYDRINEYKVEGDREITNGERKVSEVIHQAMLRCFSGKGKERHNIEGTVDFMDQPLMEISRRTGIGGPLYQVHKKAYEAHDMVRKGDSERARNELLDIIIYTAATVLLLDEQKEDK